MQGGSAGACDVDGLGFAVVGERDLELDGLALGEAAESVGFDGGLVDEEILAAVIGGDEAESLGVVEPPDLPCRPLLRHSCSIDDP